MRRKRIFDLSLLLPLLPLFALAVALLALLALCTHGRPLFFLQLRLGRERKPFRIWKLRTLTSEADPLARRPTRFGAWMRQRGLDELPQLFNVLRGEMSIVGPRPERPEYVSEFQSTVYRYGDRHRVKSGITGWAQVHGLRGRTSLADRAEWDNFYIENFSLWLDLKIVLMTATTLISPRF